MASHSDIPRKARRSVEAAGLQWRHWLGMCEAIDETDCTIEEFATFLLMFKQLLAAGVPFDVGFAARVRAMERTAFSSSDDADSDNDQEGCVDPKRAGRESDRPPL